MWNIETSRRHLDTHVIICYTAATWRGSKIGYAVACKAIICRFESGPRLQESPNGGFFYKSFVTWVISSLLEGSSSPVIYARAWTAN